MKLNSIALTLATAGLVAAQPHAHGHRHPQRRTVDTSGTVVEYELNGQRISAEEVCKGIADGTLLWAAGVAPPGACQSSSSSATPSSTPTPTPTPTPSVAPAEFLQTSSSATSTPTSSSTQAASSTPAASSSSSSSSSATGIDVDFPDGEIDCSTFPSDYGAVKLDYHGLGGWTGVQNVTAESNGLLRILATLLTRDSCISGTYCSYACPAGYQKSQWPTEPGADGQSIGGLECRNNKLYLSNPELSRKLCIQGTGGVYVQNKVGKQVAVCRTDYPGTEAETIPLALTDSTVQPLTCPDGATYYKWTGKSTSAQYYVNPKGTSIEEGCVWGDGSKPVGNWAPMNMGIGENNGKWLSLFQNTPTTNVKLDFCANITGDHLSGSCSYENGQYISESGSNDSGCTVEVMSGDATIQFYDC
ncbi:SUN family protein UTH1 [Aspergillus chevalieri]|uniref:Secreted beta-glucosidase Sun1 n=1 Tax=Aspergillus chevalieri TaxID=182096 RepID=A0A7R7ZS62_ASPCH|nr:secreted beta-glucosidase Sun1 [Aspergillus chevalieri]BCR91067.1 secreted beta-glucosidase Sun1 [Aspergillus chevalieri]